MKAKVFVMAVLVVALALFLFGSTVQADLEAMRTVESVFTALNEGSLDDAAALFAEDATFRCFVTGKSAAGPAEIGEVLAMLSNGGKHQYDIVGAHMSGDAVELVVDIADNGSVWGQETVRAVVQNGKIHSFDLTGCRLQLWRMGAGG